MRLTLRTLLAYRDGVLSPSETGNLHQRIKQSEFASNLMRRIENLVRHKQLLAPKVKGEGLGGDANTVAEYLDDTLASDQVPEFERICIAESDLVLAELAHCHQLLAEAMSSQVVVPQSLKQLAESLTSPQNQAALARRLKLGGARTISDPSVDAPIHRVDIAHSTNLANAAQSSAKDVSEQLPQVQAPMVASGGGTIKPQGLDLERPQLAHEVPEYLVGQRSGSWRILLAIAATLVLLTVIVWQALGPLQNVREMFVANNTKLGEPSKPNSESLETNSDKTSSNNESSGPSKPNLAETISTPPGNIDKSTAANEVENLASSSSNASEVPHSETPTSENSAGQSTVAKDAFRWTAEGVDKDSVLFAVSGKTKSRVVANAPLPPDAEIIVPPSMRPTLDLAGQCSWSVCGPTVMQLSQGEQVNIKTSLCRAITKAGSQGRAVTISAPTGSVKLQFEDASSMAAVEVASRPFAHGQLTDKTAFKPLLIIVAVEGQIVVTTNREAGEARSIRLVVGEGVAFSDAAPIEFELGAIPSWYRSGNDRPVDSLAAADMNKLLQGTEDVDAQLKALCSDRRPETAALAIQTQMLMGDWSNFPSLLNNEAMRSHWESAIKLAEQLVSANDQSVEAIRTAFEAVQIGRGNALLTLLVGPADISQPKELLPKLVESLGSTQLDERVLASYQLQRLTAKDMGFQPSFPNRAVLQQWRRFVATGPALAPMESPLWEAKPTQPK